MDKILAYLAAAEAFAKTAEGAFATLAAAAGLDTQTGAAFNLLAAEAGKVAAATDDAVKFVEHPDAGRAWEYFKHHGNLPGTPESRGEV